MASIEEVLTTAADEAPARADELWERTQATRDEVRRAVAAKKLALARGKSGKHHSKHLFSDFIKCGVCGGAISSVSGGKGSPRYGCSRSWLNGTTSCPNRLTIRIKVAEPLILAKLQQELVQPATLAYITNAVEKEAKKVLAAGGKKPDALRRRLDQERRKLQNLVNALEGGSVAPAAVLKAIAEKERAIAELEGELQGASRPLVARELPDVPKWVQQQLADLSQLLRTDPARVKAEFRRLNLQLAFHPTEANPRPFFTVKGQCDLSALAFSCFVPAGYDFPMRRSVALRSGCMPVLPDAVVDSLGRETAPVTAGHV